MHTEPLPEALADGDRAAAIYERLDYDVQVVKDPTLEAMTRWLSIGGWGLGPGDSLALYFAGHGTGRAGLILPDRCGVGSFFGRRPFVDAIVSASGVGAHASLTLDASYTRHTWGSAPGAGVSHDHLRDETQASTGTSASTGAADRGSFTQHLLDVAEFSPDLPTDDLLGAAAERDLNEGGKAARGKRRDDQAPRRALVVGIEAYADASLLPGAVADAQGMAGLLEGRGYEVDLRLNLAGGELYDAFEEAAAQVREGEDLILYYAGHGGYGGSLIGADGGRVPAAVVQRARDAALKKGGTSTLIVDACFSDGLHGEQEEGAAAGRPDVDEVAMDQALSRAAEQTAQDVVDLHETLEESLRPVRDGEVQGYRLDALAWSAEQLHQRAFAWNPQDPPFVDVGPSRHLPVSAAVGTLDATLRQLGHRGPRGGLGR